MTKNFKLVLAVMLAVMMLLVSSVAFAEDPVTIKITGTEEGYASSGDNAVTLANHTFNAYQVLFSGYTEGKYTNLKWGTAITDNGASLLTALKADPTLGTDFADYVLSNPINGQKTFTGASFAKVIEGYTGANASKAKALALVLRSELVKNGVAHTEVKYGQETTLTGTGYYLVDDITVLASNANDALNPVVLFATPGTNGIKIKAEKPTVQKKIDGNNDPDESTSGDVDYDTASIGAEIPYKVTTKVPNMENYEKYYMGFTDVMSYGLTFNDTKAGQTLQGVKIVVGSYPLKNTEFTVTKTSQASTKDTTKSDTKIVIEIPDLKKIVDDNSIANGADILVTYYATVNEDAIIGEEGNDNTVKLAYSNNPDKYEDGEEGNKTKVTGETVEDKVTTYVTKIKLTKVDLGDENIKLAGATFKLTGTKVVQAWVSGEKFVQDNAGDYYPLNTTPVTYTKVAPTSETASQYVGGEAALKYSKQTVNELQTKTESIDITGTTDKDGYLEIAGLGAGTYTLTETVAPDGYNLADPVSFEIKGTFSTDDYDGSQKVTWSQETAESAVTYNSTAKQFEVTVKDASGATLPETGGIGTTIFYVAGSLMVLAAAILLITKRRMGAND